MAASYTSTNTKSWSVDKPWPLPVMHPILAGVR